MLAEADPDYKGCWAANGSMNFDGFVQSYRASDDLDTDMLLMIQEKVSTHLLVL